MGEVNSQRGRGFCTPLHDYLTTRLLAEKELGKQGTIGQIPVWSETIADLVPINSQ